MSLTVSPEPYHSLLPTTGTCGTHIIIIIIIITITIILLYYYFEVSLSLSLSQTQSYVWVQRKSRIPLLFCPLVCFRPSLLLSSFQSIPLSSSPLAYPMVPTWGEAREHTNTNTHTHTHTQVAGHVSLLIGRSYGGGWADRSSLKHLAFQLYTFKLSDYG